MERLALLTLATFWAWETLRYAALSYVPAVFNYSRPMHPLLVLALPLWQLWPDWVAAAAVAALVGLLHQAMERYTATPVPLETSARRRSRLPRLPGS